MHTNHRAKQRRGSANLHLGSLGVTAKLWKQLVASEEQARIEIRVFTKGKAFTLFFEPINADDELENAFWKDEFGDG